MQTTTLAVKRESFFLQKGREWGRMTKLKKESHLLLLLPVLRTHLLARLKLRRRIQSSEKRGRKETAERKEKKDENTYIYLCTVHAQYVKSK